MICIGVETEPYDVAVTRVIDNNKVWRVLVNGYPYKSAESMGLSEYDAYVVTKMAVYCVLGQADVNTFFTYDNDAIAKKMLTKLKELVDIGFNGKETMKTGTLTSSKVGQFTELGNYYYQEYSVNSGVEIENYTITNTAGLVAGAFVANTNGIAQKSFSSGENFRVYIPKTELDKNIDVDISITAKSKTYPILYGESGNSQTQDYVLTSDPYGDENIVINLNVKTNTAKLIVNKTDDYTNEPIEGVTFGLYKLNGTEVARSVTDSKGVATFDNLFQGNYILKELFTNKNYVLDSIESEVSIQFNKTSTENIQNEHKKGNLKIYKIDKDNNKITLGGIEFELYSEEFKKVIGKYITDQNGEIYIENLRTGNYKLHEVKTNKWYNLVDDVDVVVEWNETKDTMIENELKKSQVKVIKVDKDDNKIKLEGVKFEVLDNKGNILETIVTDVNGEATTSKYAVRDFEKLYLRECETQKDYVLNNEIIEVVLEENKTMQIEIENEVKKGQVKVIKVDKDNNEIKIGGVTFEIYDENHNIVDILVTDSNGEAISKRLPINQEYTIKETITDKNYNLSDEIQKVELKENEIKSIIFENEKKKGKIEVIKVDDENNEVRLEGVTFEIIDKDGNVVDTVITNHEGKAVTKGLPIDNEYTIREKETKKEYVLSKETVSVVLEENEIKSIIFENKLKKGSIKILKVSDGNNQVLDIADGTPLVGAKFVVLNSIGETVGIYETGEDGTILIENLQYGEYTVYEYGSPNGYLLDSKPQIVFIEEDKQVVNLIFKDKPIEPELPKTGIDYNINGIFLSVISFIFTCTIIITKKIRKMEE